MSEAKNETIVCAKTFIVKHDKVLLIQRSLDSDHSAGKWEIVGGRLEFGESPTECLLREVGEETGLSIEIDKLLYVESVMVSQCKQVIGLTYLSFSNDNKPVLLSFEHQSYQWVCKAEIPAILDDTYLKSFNRYKVLDMLP